MAQQAVDPHEDSITGLQNRCEFLRNSASLVSGGAAAIALLSLTESVGAAAGIVPEDDPRLHTERITYPGESGEVLGYLARLKDEKKRPAVIVIHENKGLQPHIEDVTRRMALEGFLAVAPDALSPLGGTHKRKAQSLAVALHVRLLYCTAPPLVALTFTTLCHFLNA